MLTSSSAAAAMAPLEGALGFTSAQPSQPPKPHPTPHTSHPHARAPALSTPRTTPSAAITLLRKLCNTPDQLFSASADPEDAADADAAGGAALSGTEALAQQLRGSFPEGHEAGAAEASGKLKGACVRWARGAARLGCGMRAREEALRLRGFCGRRLLGAQLPCQHATHLTLFPTPIPLHTSPSRFPEPSACAALSAMLETLREGPADERLVVVAGWKATLDCVGAASARPLLLLVLLPLPPLLLVVGNAADCASAHSPAFPALS